MPVQVLMPALPAAMGEGTLSRWLVREGDKVAPGEVIAEIETATATMEIEAVVGGTISRVLIAAGAAGVKAGAPLAELALTHEASARPARASASIAEEAVVERVPVSPLARRLAREKGVDLSGVRGTGPNGRIIKRDVEAAAAARQEPGTTGAVVIAARSTGQLQPAQRFELVDQDFARRTRIDGLIRAAGVPHVYLTIECRLDEMLRTRARMNAMSPQRGPTAYQLSIDDFVVKAWALALQRVPAANVSYRDGATVRHRNSDVALTMSGEGGAVARVIRQAEIKSLSEISAEIRRFREDAHADAGGHGGGRGDEGRGDGGRGDDGLADGGMGPATTISNLGNFGIKSFNSVVHAPQATFLAVGAADRRPVVAGDRLEIGTMMSCTLSGDQRAVDADVCAALLAAFQGLIEDPVQMLV